MAPSIKFKFQDIMMNINDIINSNILSELTFKLSFLNKKYSETTDFKAISNGILNIAKKKLFNIPIEIPVSMTLIPKTIMLTKNIVFSCRKVFKNVLINNTILLSNTIIGNNIAI